MNYSKPLTKLHSTRFEFRTQRTMVAAIISGLLLISCDSENKQPSVSRDGSSTKRAVTGNTRIDQTHSTPVPTKDSAIEPGDNQVGPLPPKLATMGDGSDRRVQIRKFSDAASASELLLFLVAEKGNLSEVDLLETSMLSTKLEHANATDIADAIAQVGDTPWLASFMVGRLINSLAWSKSTDKWEEIAPKLARPVDKVGFIGGVLGSNAASGDYNFMSSLGNIRSHFADGSLGNLQFNQALEIAFRGIASESIPEAWAVLETIKNPLVLRSASQTLFLKYYNRDSLSATAWLDKLPDTPAKQEGVKALVEALYAAGDSESASVWQKTLDMR